MIFTKNATTNSLNDTVQIIL